MQIPPFIITGLLSGHLSSPRPQSGRGDPFQRLGIMITHTYITRLRNGLPRPPRGSAMTDFRAAAIPMPRADIIGINAETSDFWKLMKGIRDSLNVKLNIKDHTLMTLLFKNDKAVPLIADVTGMDGFIEIQDVQNDVPQLLAANPVSNSLFQIDSQAKQRVPAPFKADQDVFVYRLKRKQA